LTPRPGQPSGYDRPAVRTASPICVPDIPKRPWFRAHRYQSRHSNGPIPARAAHAPAASLGVAEIAFDWPATDAGFTSWAKARTVTSWTPSRMGDEEIHIIRPLNAYWRFIIPPVDSGAIPTVKRSVSTAVDFAVSTVFGDPA
jgi:hypothetical protein